MLIPARQFIADTNLANYIRISKEEGVSRKGESKYDSYHKFASDNFRCIYILRVIRVYKIVKNIKCLCPHYDKLSMYLHVLSCVQDR